ncbi:MAG: hydrogenase maturation nickel metallochaperone HypA [Bacilli bacterium]
MHEVALMGDILNLVVTDAQQKGFTYIKKVGVIVGEFSNAMPDALQMAFEIHKAQPAPMLTKESILEIEIEEGEAACSVCGESYKPTTRIALCPSCGLPSGTLTSGETFKVSFYEGGHTDED